ncbi:MAG: aspartate kinase [Bacteroidetes bacterium]|nr:MAG: aspartate kinase [Bacteroidota bacterium]
MQVMKFGGASVKDAEAIRNVANIMVQHATEPGLTVISAADKTTNHLEKLAYLARDGKEAEALEQFERIKRFHHGLISDLFENGAAEVYAQVDGFFEEVERIVQGILLLEEFPARTYDRIVSYGELLSTSIIAQYLRQRGEDCIWLDARTCIKTDASYAQANVIWSVTSNLIEKQVQPLLKTGRILITQGFIGSTISGKTTTLGREGSDYTASIFAHCLDARRLMVWKDVPGILNADPRIREKTIKIDNLSYEEAVEMTFYGASVIHPKTIKPLYNKHIPLYVKCFKDVSLEGTCISDQTNAELVTSYIVKKEQVFARIKPRDFSFMNEQLMEVVFNHIYKTGVKVNLVHNSAISLLLCMDDIPARIKAFESLLLDRFSVDMQQGLKLYTMINFTIKDLKQAEGARMIQQHDNKLFIVKE